MNIGKIRFVAIFATGSIVAVPAAWCQSSPDQTQSSSPIELQAVVVTAERRSENLQNVPIAVTAISGATLQNAGVGSTEDLGLVTPGLTYGMESGYALPHIRGIGTTADGLGLENSVATYVDGVYFASMPSSLMSLSDISQVAVLKGPQGTLFGRNATGGVVQITTRDPQSAFSGQADVGYGNYQSTNGDLYLTGPIASTLAANLTVHGSVQQQGFGHNIANGRDVYKVNHDVATRSKWLWTPAPGTSAILSLDYEEKLGDDASVLRPVPGAASALAGLLGKAEPPLGTYDTDTFLRPFNDLKGGGASIHLQQDVGFATLASITAYRRSWYETVFDPLTTPVPAERFDLTEADNQVSEEMNLTSKSSGRVQWVTGIFYLRSSSSEPGANLDFAGPLLSPVFPLAQLNFNGNYTTDAYAAYGQATIAITHNDHLTLGARYSQERHELESTELGYLSGGIPLGALVGPLSENFTNRRPTWRVALDHNFTPNVMGYISFNAGFKSGGFNNPPTAPPFKPEVLYAYEAGLKLDVLQHRLRFNSAAFYYDYKDIQVQFFNQSQIAFYNARGAKIYGLDSDLQALLAPGLSVTAGVSVLKDYFSEFPAAVTYTPIPIFGATGPSFLTTAPAGGHKLPFAPSATANLSLDYSHALAAGVGNLDVTYLHSTNYAFSPDNAFQQPAFNTLNLSVSWATLGEGLMVTLWGRNLTNDVVTTFVTETGPVMLAQYSPPRTYGVTLTTKF